MIKRLLVLASLIASLGCAYAGVVTPITFGADGIAVIDLSIPYVGDEQQELIFTFTILDPVGINFSGRVRGVISDDGPFGVHISSVTLNGTGSYVFEEMGPSEFVLASSFITPGSWELSVPFVTDTLGGSMFGVLSIAPVPIETPATDIPEPNAGALVLTGLCIGALILLRQRPLPRHLSS